MCCSSWGRKESDMTKLLNYEYSLQLPKDTYLQNSVYKNICLLYIFSIMQKLNILDFFFTLLYSYGIILCIHKKFPDSSSLDCMCESVLSHVRPFVTLWTGARQAPPPWDSPGKNTGVGCCFLLQGIFPTQESNLRLLRLLHCRWILYC